MGDPPRSAASITCQVCGCLNFSTEKTCEKCRTSVRPASTTASTSAPHPFMTPQRQHARPGFTARSLAGRGSSESPAPPRKPVGLGYQQANGRGTPPRGYSGRGPVLAGTFGGPRAPQTSAASRTPPGYPPGSPSDQVYPHGVIKPSVRPPFVPASTPSSTSTVGTKRPRPQGNDVIDLISSDEGEGNDSFTQRPASESQPSRLGLRTLNRDADTTTATTAGRIASPPTEEEPEPEVPSRSPLMSRVFPEIEFNASDFPSALAITLTAAQGRRPVGARSPASTVSTISEAVVTAPDVVPGLAPTSAPTPAPAQPLVPVNPPPTTPSTSVAVPNGTSSPPVVVVDDDDGDEDMVIDVDINGPYQSRRFATVEFNPRDFTTVHDGLNIARRSNGALGATIAARVEQTRVPPSVSTPSSVPVSNPPPVHSNGSISPPTAPEPSASTSTSQPAPPAAPSTTNQPNVLQPRRRRDPHQPVGVNPVFHATPTATAPAASASSAPQNGLSFVISKPALGFCASELLGFMRDDDEEDDEEQTHAELLEVVDLTHLSGESEDEEDDEDDDESGRATPEPASLTSRPNPAAAASAASPEASSSLENRSQTSQIEPAKRRRASRPMETCVLCEEKRWIKTLIRCENCAKYYHKRCAKEYGDETVCWNCELNGMIDDSELTEDHRDEVVGMLSTLRRSSESDGEEDAAQHGEEEEKDEAGDVPRVEEAEPPIAVLSSKATRSMRRWKEFLDVSTAKLDASYEETTKRISEELQDGRRRARYSKGFATKESFEAAMNEVMDEYADLQDQLDRETHEEKAKAASAMPPPVGEPQSGATGTQPVAASASTPAT